MGAIFRLDLHGDTVERLPERAFRGLYGKDTPEAPLQKLIELHPEVLPSDQIAPGTLEPDRPRFVTLAVEIDNADVLLADQNGQLTIVETKMVENAEARRTVMAQVIDYAANAQSRWNAAALKERAASYWVNKRQGDADEAIRYVLDEGSDIENFWAAVQRNLEEGNIRLVVAGDTIPPETRRMIEYLNSEMRNAEVIGVEFKCYGSGSDEVILAPRVVGQTQAVSEKKTPAASPRTEAWTEEDWLAKLEQTTEVAATDERRDIGRRWLAMCRRLRDEGLPVSIVGGRGPKDVAVELDCNEVKVVSFSATYGYLSVGLTQIPANDYNALREEMAAALNVPAKVLQGLDEKHWFGKLIDYIVRNDPNLEKLEAWVRSAIARIRKLA